MGLHRQTHYDILQIGYISNHRIPGFFIMDLHTMQRLVLFLFGFAGSILLSCVYQNATPVATYTTIVEYQDQAFSGGMLSGQNILVLPILLKNGFDTTTALGANQIGKMLSSRGNDIEVVTKEEFEGRYCVRHDSASLSAFYRNMFKGNSVALATSDSVWKEMKTGYCFSAAITNAITIKDFDGLVKRRMNMETEIWDVDSIEPVFRVSVQASAQSAQMTDVEFIRAALAASFDKLSGAAPGSNERNW